MTDVENVGSSVEVTTDVNTLVDNHAVPTLSLIHI